MSSDTGFLFFGFLRIGIIMGRHENGYFFNGSQKKSGKVKRGNR